MIIITSWNAYMQNAQEKNYVAVPFCSTFSKLLRELRAPHLILNGEKVHGIVKEGENVQCKRLPDGKSEVTVTEYETEVDHNPYGDWGNSHYTQFKEYRYTKNFVVQPSTVA